MTDLIRVLLVKTYKHRIGEKLGISGRPAVVRFALQADLLVPWLVGGNMMART